MKGTDSQKCARFSHCAKSSQSRATAQGTDFAFSRTHAKALVGGVLSIISALVVL